MIERHASIDPTHPGEILREDILPALCMSKTAVADALGISRQTLYGILNEKQPVTAEMAVRFWQAVWQRRRLLGEPATHIRLGGRGAHGGCLRDNDPRCADRINRPEPADRTKEASSDRLRPLVDHTQPLLSSRAGERLVHGHSLLQQRQEKRPEFARIGTPDKRIRPEYAGVSMAVFLCGVDDDERLSSVCTKFANRSRRQLGHTLVSPRASCSRSRHSLSHRCRDVLRRDEFHAMHRESSRAEVLYWNCAFDNLSGHHMLRIEHLAEQYLVVLNDTRRQARRSADSFVSMRESRQVEG